MVVGVWSRYAQISLPECYTTPNALILCQTPCSESAAERFVQGLVHEAVSVGYIHNMSMRTALYGTMSYVNNKGGANFSLSGGATGIAVGGNSTGAEVGIRHSF